MTINLTINIGCQQPLVIEKVLNLLTTESFHVNGGDGVTEPHVTKSSEKEPLVRRLRQEIDKASLACSSSTTINRRTAVNALEKFFNERLEGGKHITIGTLNADHIKGFERWHVEKRLTANYCACNMRNLRALLNRIGGMERQEHVRLLFKDVRTKKTQARTKKAVSEETIVRLASLETEADSFEETAKDLFLFCLMSRGMPLIDALYLKKSQLKDGRIIYNRHKTQNMARPEATPGVMRIIEKYSSGDSDYLLPFLTSTDPVDSERQYRNFLQKYNRTLTKLSKRIAPDCKLTSYTPRHSWASIAHKLGISDNDISQALAHTNTSTTQEYLKSICDEKIDEDNRRVLEFLGRMGKNCVNGDK